MKLIRSAKGYVNAVNKRRHPPWTQVLSAYAVGPRCSVRS